MRLSDLHYDYPKSLVAKYPAEPRDSARLMVLDRKRRSIEHRIFRDIVDYFNEGDVLVVNNTKVFPARLYGRKEKTGARIEVLLLRELNAESRLWDALVDPARKIRVGNKIYFDGGLVAEVIDNTTSRGRTIRFLFDGSDEELYQKIEASAPGVAVRPVAETACAVLPAAIRARPPVPARLPDPRLAAAPPRSFAYPPVRESAWHLQRKTAGIFPERRCGRPP